MRVVASGPSADFYAGWLRGYDLSGPVTRAVIAEAEKALAVARDTLTQLQQEAPSAAAVSASGASGATSSGAESSLLTSTSAELVSSSDQAERFYTPSSRGLWTGRRGAFAVGVGADPGPRGSGAQRGCVGRGSGPEATAEPSP